MTDEIVGAHFTNDFIPEGKLRFGPVATAAIKIWCQNEGFAGIRLEDYLDKVLGRHQ